MHTEKKDNKRLRATYEQAMKVKSAIPHPLIMGVIHECGGKMHMQERDWESASKCLFDAFKNYDEAGNQKRIQCLKYLILGKMLSLEDANIFEAPEVKPYKQDPEITAMNDLMMAYQRNEIKNFEQILKQNQKKIMEVPSSPPPPSSSPPSFSLPFNSPLFPSPPPPPRLPPSF